MDITLHGRQLKQGLLYLGHSLIYIYIYIYIYINDLSDDLASNTKLLTRDTSLFSVVGSMTKSANELSKDLAKISKRHSNRKRTLR